MYWWRFLRVAIASLWTRESSLRACEQLLEKLDQSQIDHDIFHQKRLDLFKHKSWYRTSLIDLDPNIHMNNTVFLSFGDFGRVDFIVRTGLLKKLRRTGGQYVMGGVNIRFRRSLAIGQKFHVTTEYIGHDGKWFYFFHYFKNTKNQIVASSVSRGCMAQNHQLIDVSPFLKAQDLGIIDFMPSKEIQEQLAQWNHFDQWSYDLMEQKIKK